MADTELKGFTFDTERPVLGAFLNLAEARTITKSPDEKANFSGDFEFDDTADADQITRLRGLIMDAAKELFPNGVPDDETGTVISISDAIKAGKFKVPLQSGERLANKAKAKSEASGKERLREWSRGKQVLTARSKDEYPPAVTYLENGRMVVLEDKAALKAAQGKRFFTGALVLVGVKLRAYKAVGANGLPGVKAYLEQVTATGGGEKLIAGGRDPTSRFSGYVGINTEDTGGAGDGTEW
jgi:hypothetical protein